MTLDDAIQILEFELDAGKTDFGRDLCDTIELGLQALVLIQTNRSNGRVITRQTLPGETKE